MQVSSVETEAVDVLKPVEGKSNHAGEHDFMSVLATITGGCWQPVRNQRNHFLLAPLPATDLVSSPVVQKMQLMEEKQVCEAMVSGDLWFGRAEEADLADSLQSTLASPFSCREPGVTPLVPALSAGYEIKSENNPVPAVKVQSNTGEVSVPGMVRQIPVEDSVLLHREFTTGSKSNVETEMQWVVRGEVVKNGGHDGSVAFSDLSRVRFPVTAAMQEVNISLASAAGRLREQFSSEAELQLAGSKTESAVAVVVAATQKSELQNSPWLFVQYGQDFGAGAERFESMLVPSEMVVKTEGIYKDNGWKHDITPQASILPAPGADIPIPSSSAPLGAVLVSAFCQVVSRGGFNRTIIRLKLEPEHLGELKVLLTYFRGKLTADFYTFNHPAREAVEALFPQLREVLASYNVRLENAAVHLNQNDGYGEGGSLKNEGSDKDPAKSGQLYGPEDPVPAGTEDGRKMYVAESVIDRLV